MRVTIKGQVTIPKDIRDQLGIEPGSDVEFVREDGAVILKKKVTPPKETVEDFRQWAANVAGTVDTMGMDGKEFVDWLRGPREDLDLDR
jgi:AbrB family looped-hinge helix DNA binding protein